MFNHALRDARLRQPCNSTIPETAWSCGISESQYSRFEAGTHTPKPETTLEMASVLEAPELIFLHCRHVCPIGQIYAYEVPDPTRISLSDITLELWKETDEAKEVLLRLREVVVGKSKKTDFNPDELDILNMALNEYMHIERALVKAKVKLMGWFESDIKKEPVPAGPQINAYA